MSKRRVFGIDFDPNSEDSSSIPAPVDEPTRRGPMAVAISENATALSYRQATEADIRAENDRLAHEYVSLKRDGAIVARVPLGDIRMDKLTRDRGAGEAPEFGELKTSIRDLGLPIQFRLRTPVTTALPLFPPFWAPKARRLRNSIAAWWMGTS